MHYVKSKDKRTGITYVYESESYWDKEKQQPRAHRKLIGKLDEETGEIIPTDGRGRKRKDRPQEAPVEQVQATSAPELSPAETVALEELRQKDEVIRRLRAENEQLRREKEAILKELADLVGRHTAQ